MNIKESYKKHPLLATGILMLLISVLIVLVVSNALGFFTRHGNEYPIPDLRGFDAEQLAQYQRDSNDFDFTILINDSVFVPSKKGGTVLSQDPLPGNKAKKGRKIYLSIVAWNSPQIEMVNLVDLSLRQATNLLISNDLQVGQIIYKASKYPNAVLEQRYDGRIVEAGTLLPYQAKITLIVGKESSDADEEEDTVDE
jgi:beta-lactam-binding protein with PASTA domain